MAVQNANAIVKALRAERRVIPAALQEGTDNTQQALRQLLSVPSPPPSAPGTPPHMRTGGVRDSAKGKLTSSTSTRLYMDTVIAIYLDRGTHSHKTGRQKMAPRPFFTKFATIVFPDKVRASLVRYMSAAARGSR